MIGISFLRRKGGRRSLTVWVGYLIQRMNCLHVGRNFKTSWRFG
ncbi:MAG: hypothetical protein ACOYLR_11795 [Chlorobium sp.]